MARTPEHFYIRRGAWRRFAPLDTIPDDNYDPLWDDEDLDFAAPDDEVDEYEVEDASAADAGPTPLWTREQRILLTLIVILMLIALLVYSFQGFFIPPPPPPTLAPGSLI